MNAAVAAAASSRPGRGNSNASTLTGNSGSMIGTPGYTPLSVNAVPPPAVNIREPVALTLGLTPAQRCSAAGADMETCKSVTERISALEQQAAISCVQCDAIRAQIAELRAQITPPVRPVPTAAALRYGKATPQPIIGQGDMRVCDAPLSGLQRYAAELPQTVSQAKYSAQIKPLINALAINSRPQIKALRDELKSYDPPGAFMSVFKKPKSTQSLGNVARRVGAAIGCPSRPPPPGNTEFYENGNTATGGARRKRRASRRRRVTRRHRNTQKQRR